MRRKSMLKTLYHVVAALSILNLIAVSGLGAMLYSGGYLSPGKAREIVDIMRRDPNEPVTGEGETADQPGTPPVQPEEELVDTAWSQVVDRSQKALIDQEVMLREKVRFQSEMEMRKTLNDAAMLRITTRLDALHAEMAAEDRRRQEEFQIKDDSGFAKELEIFRQLKPDQALNYLLNRDPVDAARVLESLDGRKTAEILESAKTEQQRQQVGIIMSRLRSLDAETGDSSGNSPPAGGTSSGPTAGLNSPSSGGQPGNTPRGAQP